MEHIGLAASGASLFDLASTLLKFCDFITLPQDSDEALEDCIVKIRTLGLRVMIFIKVLVLEIQGHELSSLRKHWNDKTADGHTFGEAMLGSFQEIVNQLENVSEVTKTYGLSTADTSTNPHKQLWTRLPSLRAIDVAFKVVSRLGRISCSDRYYWAICNASRFATLLTAISSTLDVLERSYELLGVCEASKHKLECVAVQVLDRSSIALLARAVGDPIAAFIASSATVSTDDDAWVDIPDSTPSNRYIDNNVEGTAWCHNGNPGKNAPPSTAKYVYAGNQTRGKSRTINGNVSGKDAKKFFGGW